MYTQIRKQIFAAAGIFVGLAIAYATLVIAAISVADPLAQAVLVSTGSTLFGSGLTFLLIRGFQAGERGA